ncbi:MAG: 2-oxoglutarate dehydrogenase complex dihydrolipoyllysine-residue succinyltransferase [Sphingomonadaceae bacterium]
MAGEIVVPPLGESVLEATVGRWLKGEGEAVAAGEPVVELETEKVSVQVSAEEGGVLSRILHPQGDTVRPGDVLGVVEVGAEAARPAPEAAPPAPAPQEVARPAAAAPPGVAAGAAREAVAPQVQPAPSAERAPVSPVAQRMAEELGLDLSRVRGTGPGGRIMKEDVERYVRQMAAQVAPERPAAAPPPPPPAPTPAAPAPAPAAPPPPQAPPVAPAPPGRPEVRQRLSRRRATIARRLVEAQRTAAMLSTFNEIDMSAVMDLRRRRRESFRQSTGVDLGLMPFFVKAVVGALKSYPQVNSELQGEELVLKQYYDIGIAIADPEGLVVPVVRDADRLTFAQIEETINGFVQKVRDRSLSIEELRGGTFTITNGGVFGSLLSTPILNPPQVGILGMHKIEERPVAVKGEVAIRPMMYVALSYDHRVVDGREAVLFLVRVKELIEDPERLLLEG